MSRFCLSSFDGCVPRAKNQPNRTEEKGKKSVQNLSTYKYFYYRCCQQMFKIKNSKECLGIIDVLTWCFLSGCEKGILWDRDRRTMSSTKGSGLLGA